MRHNQLKDSTNILLFKNSTLFFYCLNSVLNKIMKLVIDNYDTEYYYCVLVITFNFLSSDNKIHTNNYNI